jgi:hypothetical protein
VGHDPPYLLYALSTFDPFTRYSRRRKHVITTTLNDLLEGKLAGHDMAEYWLYVVRDVEENMTLYVGQSQHPVKRLLIISKQALHLEV